MLRLRRWIWFYPFVGRTTRLRLLSSTVTCISHAEVARLFRGLAPFVGLGPDKIGTEALKLLPHWMSERIVPLLEKRLTRLEIPLQWQGGSLFALYKGRGSREDVGAYCDITVCCAAPKAYGKSLRTRLVKALASATGTDPCIQHDAGIQYGGGLNGGSTDIPHLSMHAVGGLASAYDQCYGVLFVDLTAAFASIDRLLAFGGPSSSEELGARLRTEGYAPEACRKFVDAI